MIQAPQSRQRSGMKQSKTIASHFRKQWSIWTWTATILLVNMSLIWGDVRSGLLFLPEAVVSGEWWRVITYPLVHLSWYHLLLDATGFLLLYTCLEEKRPLSKAIYIVGASAGALFLTMVLDPAISSQGLSGLSGIAHGLMAISAMETIQHKDQRRWGYLCLVAVVSKSAYELWSGQVLFSFLHMGLCGQPLAASHAGGVIGGLFAFILIYAGRRRRKKPRISALKNDTTTNLTPSRAQRFMGALIRPLTRTMYRVRYEGLEHIPEHGPAVLVCNHVSYVDWLIITSACNRPIHFVMHAAIYRMPVLRWVFRMGRAIPIDAGKKNPAVLKQAFNRIDEILQSGGLICIFPEGGLTRTGRINRFRPGIEKIIQRNPVPVIPLALRGLWGSFFSHKGGPAMRRWPKKILARIELAVGHTIPPRHATARNLRCAVQSLHGELS